MQPKLLYLLLATAARAGSILEDALGFDPSWLTVPDNTTDDLTRYFDPQVMASVANQTKDDKPQRLAKPGTQVPVSTQELIDSFELAYMSFCPSRYVLTMQCICDRDYTTVEASYSPSLQASALLVVFPKRQILAVSYVFTKTIRNIITDYDIEPIQLPNAPKGVKVHRGMYKHYMSIHNETMARASNLLKTKCQGCRIMATGYSLGGSLATLSAPFWHEFKQTHDVRVDVIAYAGLRTGNLAAKLYFESLSIPITRYTNQNDIITMLPPRSIGYIHAGVEIYEYATSFPSTTALRICRQDYDEDPNCQWQDPQPPTFLRHYFPLNQFVPLPPYCNNPRPFSVRLPAISFQPEP